MPFPGSLGPGPAVPNSVEFPGEIGPRVGESPAFWTRNRVFVPESHECRLGGGFCGLSRCRALGKRLRQSLGRGW